MLDIAVLRMIWWALLGILLMGFAITDGFDLGAAILFPLVAREEVERRIVLNTIGPIWEGNQVWIILGAGAIFAAWPFVYAAAFSTFYLMMLLLLLTMGISRPVSFKYRSKLSNVFWRACWDRIVFIGGFFPAIICGLLIGNVLEGAPFYFDHDLRIFYKGSFWSQFHPFPLWCGLTSLMMLTMHGGLFLAIKTNAPIRQRAIFWTRMAAVFLIVLFIVGGYWVAQLSGYTVLQGTSPYGVSNPLLYHKQIILKIGAWLDNYYRYPWTTLVPAVGILGPLGVFLTANIGMGYFAFILSSLSIIGIIGTVGVSLFPFLLPSSVHWNSSLLVWDASSSQMTLSVMLWAVIIFLPIVLLYTSWVYRVLRGKVDLQSMENNAEHSAY